MRALFDTALEPEVKPAEPRWADLRTRATSALVLGPAAIFCVWTGGLAWTLLILVAMAGLGWEWGKLAGLARPYLPGAALVLVWAADVCGGPLAGLLAAALLWLGTSLVLGRFAGYGVPYAGLGGIALIWLRLQPLNGLFATLFLVGVVWGTDIGAYLAGRLIGGPKLAPRISPGKTWAGALGGLAAAGLAGAVIAGGGHGLDPRALPFAVLLSFCAQAGDLLESAIKRRLGVKDSGRTIPGHGGLFDRLDGFLAAAPVAAVLALCVQGGNSWL